MKKNYLPGFVWTLSLARYRRYLFGFTIQNLLRGTELLPVANYGTGISFLFHLPVQSCHLIFETVGLEAVALFVFIST